MTKLDSVLKSKRSVKSELWCSSKSCTDVTLRIRWPVGVMMKPIAIVISVIQFSMCIGVNFFLFWLQNTLEHSLFPPLSSFSSFRIR